MVASRSDLLQISHLKKTVSDYYAIVIDLKLQALQHRTVTSICKETVVHAIVCQTQNIVSLKIALQLRSSLILQIILDDIKGSNSGRVNNTLSLYHQLGESRRLSLSTGCPQ